MTLFCNQALLTVTEQSVSSLICPAPKSCRSGRSLPSLSWVPAGVRQQCSSPLHPCAPDSSVPVPILSFL